MKSSKSENKKDLTKNQRLLLDLLVHRGDEAKDLTHILSHHGNLFHVKTKGRDKVAEELAVDLYYLGKRGLAQVKYHPYEITFKGRIKNFFNSPFEAE